MIELFNEINEGFCFHTLRETNTMPDSTACRSILIAFKVKFVFIFTGDRRTYKSKKQTARILYSRTSFNLVFRSADCNEPITNAEDRCLFHVYANKARSSKRVRLGPNMCKDYRNMHVMHRKHGLYSNSGLTSHKTGCRI